MARGRERDLAGRDLVALADDAGDLRAHLLDRDVERLEHARGETFLLAQQPEQDVLGADVVVLERPRLVLCENDDLASSLCESLEHSMPLCRPVAASTIALIRVRPSYPRPAAVWRSGSGVPPDISRMIVLRNRSRGAFLSAEAA